VAKQLTVSSRLTLDTTDFKRGAAETDQIGDQMVAKERRRASQYDEITTARVRNSAAADAAAAAREQATADRAARRLADQQAKEEAAAKRREEREAQSAAKASQRAAEIAAREETATKRREEREAASAERSARTATEAATKKAAAAQRAAEQEVANDNRRATHRAGQLSFQVNDIVTQLGSGTNPLTVLVQQGPQITQIYGGVGATLRAIPLVAATAVTAIAAVVGVLAIGASTAVENEARQRRFNVELAATGNVAGTTATELERLVRIEAMRAGGGRGVTAQALGSLTANPLLGSEDQLGRVLALSRDYAAVAGKDLPAAASELSQSFDGTFASAKRLDQAYGILTAREYEQIRALDEQGKKQEAANTLIEAAERRFKGLNEQGLSPTEKNLNQLANAWVKFKDAVANNPVTAAMIWAGGHVVNGAAMAIGGPPGAPGAAGAAGDPYAKTPSAGDRADAQRSYDNAVAQLQILQADRKTAAPGDLHHFDRDIRAVEQRIAHLKANLANLDGQINARGAASSEQQQASQQQQAQAAIERQAKAYQDLVASYRTVNAETSKLLGDRDRLDAAIKSGVLSPEDLGRARQALAETEGKLYGLKTASDELQRSIDLEKKYAGLPQHAQAAERAFDQMYDAARKAGDSHDQAIAKANQARTNALAQQSTATREQIAALGEEARAALAVAEAYGTSRAAGLRAAAIGAAQAAEAQGQIAPGTAGIVAQETLEKNAAATVAAAAEKNRAYAEEVAGLDRVASAEKVSAEAAREAERQNRVTAFAVELRAQAEASGSAAIVAAAEREIAAYDRRSKQQLDIDRRRAANQLNQQYDPELAHQQQMANLQALQENGELSARTVAEASKAYDLQRLESSRSATDGMVAGFRRYAEEAQNAGAQVAQATQNAMRSAEDAIVQFAMTGKLSFSDLTNSILADVVRIAARQTITGPLSNALGSVFSSAGSWLGGALGSSSVGGLGAAHSGGMIGALTSAPRTLPIMAFANAPRFHGGGIMGLAADEIPIIGKRGEEVLTEGDPRHRSNWRRGDGGNGRPVTLKLVNMGPPMEAQEGQTRDDGQGGMELEVILEKILDYAADQVAAGRGRFTGAIEQSYGLQRRGRG
jgi:lambda family phage tail tape measure protein